MRAMMAVMVLVVAMLAPLSLAAPEQKYAKSSKEKLVSRQICTDLCTQGLGGPPCGDVCEHDLGHDFGRTVPKVEKSLLKTKIVGPRRNICPYLCQYELGEPLCQCEPLNYHQDKTTIDWHGVCAAFCHVEGLTIYGCPKCHRDPSKIPSIPLRPYSDEFKPVKKPDAETLIKHGFKIVAAFDDKGRAMVSDSGANLLPDLSETHDVKEVKWGVDNNEVWKLSVPKTSDKEVEQPIDWDHWCEIKCYAGEGGSACNCDMLP